MDGKAIAAKRRQAERNVKEHIDKILSAAAAEVAKAAEGIRLSSSEKAFSHHVQTRTQSIIEQAEKDINDYIRAYSKACITVLGDKDTGATGRLLNSKLFGRTFEERTAEYVNYFFEDCVKMIYAGRKLRMKATDIEKMVQGEFKDPYVNGTIGKAEAKNVNISMPSRRRGLFRSAYGNIVRNAQGTIAVAWAREEYNYNKRNGAVGFIPHRGSTYPCDICDGHAERLHKMNDPADPPPLYHSRCCCYTTYVFKGDINDNSEDD